LQLVDSALPLYSAFLTALQFAAAVAVLVSRFPSKSARVSASVLVAANGAITLMDVFKELQVGTDLAQRISFLADAPTAFIAALLVAQLRWPNANPRVRDWPLIAAAIVTLAAAMFAPVSGTFQNIVEGYGVFLAYTFAAVALAHGYAKSPAWPNLWIFVAFLIRGSDFAVRFLLIQSDPIGIACHIVLFIGTLWSVWRVLSSPRVASDAKIIVGVVATTGAVLALAGIASLTPYAESLVTLSIGRPVLLLIGLAPAGFVRPFFRGAVAGTATFFAAVVGALWLGLTTSFLLLLVFGSAMTTLVVTGLWLHNRVVHLTPGTGGPMERIRPLRAPQLEDWERLLEALRPFDDNIGASRRELADLLGILPRNVHRLFDAANRSNLAPAGTELVRSWYARGKRNQLEYRYALTPAGRASLIQPAAPQGPTNASVVQSHAAPR
jgi:hypothetical protein